MKSQYVLSFSCQNRPGIVAAVATCLFEQGGDIREAQQYDDAETGKFFARIAFDFIGAERLEDIRASLAEVAVKFGFTWHLNDHTAPRRVLLLVSKFDHCLVDLLYRWRIGELKMTPAAIVSNHGAEHFAGIDLAGIPFHHLPITKDTKMEQE
ncbi:MAG: formyltetrahydrofolate deformylase, partial [Acidocella sp. 21-58-7]